METKPQRLPQEISDQLESMEVSEQVELLLYATIRDMMENPDKYKHVDRGQFKDIYRSAMSLHALTLMLDLMKTAVAAGEKRKASLEKIFESIIGAAHSAVQKETTHFFNLLSLLSPESQATATTKPSEWES